MKCIKSIKATKNTEVGHVVRIDDVEAESKVKSGYWAYVPKSEWKLVTRKPKNDQTNDQEPTKKGRKKDEKQNQ